MQTDLMVYTGTHGVLTLTNGDGKKVAIYLEPLKRKIPVPEHIWKVCEGQGASAVVAAVDT